MKKPFERDPSHWLFKFSPEEWIRAAMAELRRAEAAVDAKNARAGLAGCRRAAGMAVNAMLAGEPNDSFGRTYMDHLSALAKDERAPAAVRDACRALLETQPPNPTLVTLRSAASDRRLVEATKDVIAHAYAVSLTSRP